MLRNDFVSNSSSSSFIIGYKNKEARKKFAEYCKNSGYGIISDIMYNRIMSGINIEDQKQLKMHYNYWIDFNSDDIKKYDSFSEHIENSSEMNDYVYADTTIYEILYEKYYNDDNVKIVWNEGGW